ncbi:methenyltetrahydrofolate cyclohydrolase FchA [Gottschalkia acidurici 9a]|uniref:Methenyltetrahydrofolate cyclohydrolase FchA n=1 Tax=Gottschalkia acidurici (strain ATCC 7906 / DSM 604 / BCRC 14475 / CIP 104303 / KCTC 5404 / NCIMB 10678 / 9a) TaxID=1128398 RepID=K0B439_GOTA9|nr:cyclodeaminase/cyclohydrolase family protein [Gottschalkia acidurici]AFS79882.1 methenyltetrahydrofolate cyclohydrolase FchA [Gottschalkia acidurici 9a]
MLLVERTVNDFVEVVESDAPAPGGGSVSALAAGLGSALTAMVGGLSIGRKAFDALEDSQKTEIEEGTKKAIELRKRLMEIVDEDTNAFNDYMEALKLPKETDEEKAARKQAMEDAMKGAVRVPLEAAQKALESVKLIDSFLKYGNQNAITDAGVASLIGTAGVQGAVYNVLINLGSISDQAFNDEMRKTCDELVKEAKALREVHEKDVFSKLA